MSISPSLTSSVLDSSKNLQRNSSILQWVILVIACISVFFAGDVSYCLAVLILLLELGILLLKHFAAKKKKLGQQCSRVSILSNGLGVSDAVAVSYLNSEISEEEFKSEAKFQVDDYYSSTETAGPQRLKEILVESCYWTTNLYKKSYESIRTSLIVYSSVYIAILFFSLDFNFIRESMPFDKIMILIISAAPLKDLLNDAIKFNNSSSDLRRLDERLSTDSCSSDEVLLVFSDYAVITSNTPLISDSIYKKNQKQLNNSWKIRTDI